MSAHKTPYEIRLNLLELAHKIEKDKAQAKSAEEFLKNDNDNKEFLITQAPESADVLATAETLNEFVSKENKR
jgi:hypothetical protein